MMNKHRIAAGFLTPVMITILGLSFRYNDPPEEVISKRFQHRQDTLQIAAIRLNAAIATRNQPAIRIAYDQVRSAYKKWEYLGEYKHSVLAKDQLNGAPLPKPEDNAFGAIILAPRGLQVMDELIGELEEDSSIEKLALLSKSYSETIISLPDSIICYDHEIFEAARLELIRIFTLSLTGFDTPGTESALKDARTALQILQSDIEIYTGSGEIAKSHLRDMAARAFDKGNKMLSSSVSFDNFDRLRFLREVINPLYKCLLDIQVALEIPLPHEVRSVRSALNYRSDNLFSSDFLDAAYFSAIPASFRTAEAVELGKLLFFDPVLSSNNQRACASCHNPEKAFTDGLEKSVAMNLNGTVQRNSPTLVNCIYSEKYFYDFRADALEDQLTHVITDQKEFNSNIEAILNKLSGSAEYRERFSHTFREYPGPALSAQTLSFAISAFVGSLQSFNSPFDRYIRGETNQLNPDIINGFNLFMGKAGCGTCHFAPLFSGTVPPDYSESESEVLGVPVKWPAKKPALDPDRGRGAAKIKDQLDIYQYSFKTPTVRNSQVTAPYMHNGSMKTLNDVLDFYNQGGGQGLGLVVEHQTLPPDKLNLKPREIRQIIAFLQSLTDYSSLAVKPERLPAFGDSMLNRRMPGGVY